MREFRFRAWKNDVRVPDGAFLIYPDGEITLLDPEERAYCYDAGVWLEQYTGLKDKNGREIYVGDIIKTTYLVTDETMQFGRGVIEFEQGVYRICNYFSDRCVWHSELLCRYQDQELEVVGNIHENPELLGEEWC